MRSIYILLLLLYACNIFAQNHHNRFESIDIQHYIFEIHLNDTNNLVSGKTTVNVKILKRGNNLTLDLVGTNTNQKGMTVTSVESNNNKLDYIHKNDQLRIILDKPAEPGDVFNIEIEYSGTPADGLVISENKYGERTFFGDNWPDRAKHWLPTVDHPSDKATLEFKVFAPQHYEVISNGYLIEKKQHKNAVEFTHWKEDVPLSTKLMVIGVADFTVGNKENFNKIPVSSWVFSQNDEKGFENYKYGTKALKYFSEIIGSYPYEKLAHVQSKTRYGGMENASCIFYHENTAISDKSQERLFAHEVAHQWFGNSVTEQNWHHVWLSEGFATYLTHVYNQHFHGENMFREGLKKDRERVIKYAEKKPAPVIDTTVTEYIRLLNANSYQKAGWFLHMLREDLGDSIFFRGLQNYYTNFKNSTALTHDFQNVMETVSDKDLDLFFKQWLWQPGYPVLDINWKQENDQQLKISIKQLQKNSGFVFPLEVKVVYKDNTSEKFTANVNKGMFDFTCSTSRKIDHVVFDPDVKLLFDRIHRKE